MTVATVVFLVLGIATLIVGANLLVSGASGAAIGLGIHPVVVGLTVVAFGTSAPELAVSIDAGRTGEVEVALGNVIGSSIANILLILGVAAAAGGVMVSHRVRRVELPLLVAVSAIVTALALDGSYGRIDGAVLATGFIIYALWVVRAARHERRSSTSDSTDPAVDTRSPTASWWLLAARILSGLVLLVIGADWLVSSAEEAAIALGVSEVVVGLTVVAVGTSLPELVTTVVAARRGERDLAVGNAVGSNLFNLLAALGAAVLVSPAGAEVGRSLLVVDLPVMLAAAVALWLVARHSGVLRARTGALMLTSYGIYLAVVASMAGST